MRAVDRASWWAVGSSKSTRFAWIGASQVVNVTRRRAGDLDRHAAVADAAEDRVRAGPHPACRPARSGGRCRRWRGRRDRGARRTRSGWRKRWAPCRPPAGRRVECGRRFARPRPWSRSAGRRPLRRPSGRPAWSGLDQQAGRRPDGRRCAERVELLLEGRDRYGRRVERRRRHHEPGQPRDGDDERGQDAVAPEEPGSVPPGRGSDDLAGTRHGCAKVARAVRRAPVSTMPARRPVGAGPLPS